MKKSANMVIKEEKEDGKNSQKLSKGYNNEENVDKGKIKNLRSGRLIVRNLSFKSNEDLIRKHFSKFGEISEVNLLKKGNKLVGCCFIQFKEKLSAAKAIAKLSGQPFMGRPIVVDWALPKNKFTKTIKKELKSEEGEVVVKEEPKESSSEEDEDEKNNDAEVDSSENGDSEEDDESQESDEDSDVSLGKEEPENKKIGFPTHEKKKNKKFHFQYDPEDVADGRTVFLKNVPFSANDDDLLKCAEEVGPVVYAVICMDPLTEHSKGTAFVKFNDKSVVEDIICGKSKLVLKGTKLDAYLALKKNQVLQKSEAKCPKDNRNLYLLREGVVLAGTPAAEGVSEGDMSKRLQLEHWKTQTLRNLNKFVSNKRLVVHNVPPFYDDNKLCQVFKENSPKGSVITESRIIRNLNDIDDKGIGKSKGFGFVTYTQHEDALAALRKINNNPHIFKENKRPIVGFSIENRGALRLKEKRKTKSQNPPPKSTSDKEIKSSGSRPENKKRKYNKLEENIPEYCGYTAKPGAKKMRSGKELKVQAALHHKALVDKKRAQKRLRFTGRWKNKKNLKRNKH